MTTTNVNFITGKLTWIPLSLELDSRLTSHTVSTTQTFFICWTARPYFKRTQRTVWKLSRSDRFQTYSDDKLVSSDILVHQMITTYSTTFFSLARNYQVEDNGARDNCIQSLPGPEFSWSRETKAGQRSHKALLNCRVAFVNDIAWSPNDAFHHQQGISTLASPADWLLSLASTLNENWGVDSGQCSFKRELPCFSFSCPRHRPRMIRTIHKLCRYRNVCLDFRIGHPQIEHKELNLTSFPVSDTCRIPNPKSRWPWLFSVR